MATWGGFQEGVGFVVRQQWEERQALLLLLGIIEATHRDRQSMDYLTEVLRLGNWSPALVRFARYVAEKHHAELLERC